MRHVDFTHALRFNPRTRVPAPDRVWARSHDRYRGRCRVRLCKARDRVLPLQAMPTHNTITIIAHPSSALAHELHNAHSAPEAVKLYNTGYLVAGCTTRVGGPTEFSLQEYCSVTAMPPVEVLGGPGAKAALLSGGPIMTVMSVDGDNVKCIWSTGDGYCECTFPAAVLSIGKLSKGE